MYNNDDSQQEDNEHEFSPISLISENSLLSNSYKFPNTTKMDSTYNENTMDTHQQYSSSTPDNNNNPTKPYSIVVETNNDTIEILTTYGFPKTSHHYSSKGKECILNQFRSQIIEYFIENHIDIQQFYNSTLNKSDFVANTTKYIKNSTSNSFTNPIINTQNTNDVELQRALKQLYTILAMYQFSDECRSKIEPFPTTYDHHYSQLQNIEISSTNFLKSNHIASSSTTSDDDKNLQQQLQSMEDMDIRSIRRASRESQRNDDMIRALSESQSKLLSLEENNKILTEIADQHRLKMIDSEHKEKQYKQTVNQLQNELEKEKHRINRICDKNQMLQQQLNKKENEMLNVTHELNGKLAKLQDEKQKLQKMIMQFGINLEQNNSCNNGTDGMKTKTTSNLPNNNNNGQIHYNNKRVRKAPNGYRYKKKSDVTGHNEENKVISVNLTQSNSTQPKGEIMSDTDNESESDDDEEDDTETDSESDNDEEDRKEEKEDMEEQEGKKKLKIMYDYDIASLCAFYKRTEDDSYDDIDIDSDDDNYKNGQKSNDKKDKGNFWDKFFGEFKCVPSWK